MSKIKIVGYLDTEEMNEEHVDYNHPSGLTEQGDAAVSTYDGDDNGITYKIADLEDLSMTLVED